MAPERLQFIDVLNFMAICFFMFMSRYICNTIFYDINENVLSDEDFSLVNGKTHKISYIHLFVKNFRNTNFSWSNKKTINMDTIYTCSYIMCDIFTIYTKNKTKKSLVKNRFYTDLWSTQD